MTSESAAGRSVAVFGGAIAVLVASLVCGLWAMHLGVVEQEPFLHGYVPDPLALAIVSTATAVVVATATVLQLFSPRFFDWAWFLGVVGLVVVGGAWIRLTWGNPPDTIVDGLQDFPLQSGLVLTIASWLLAQLGCLAVLIAALMGRNYFAAYDVRKALLAGFCVGLLVAGVAVGHVNRVIDAGDAGQLTTATATDVPPLPDRFGPQVFTLTGGDIRDANLLFAGNDVFETLVLPAGPGFVVRFDDGVRAYDSTGNERWSYVSHSQPPAPTATMRTYDDGQTVVVQFGSKPWASASRLLALDATTGTVLWSSTDESMIRALEFEHAWSPNSDQIRYLVDRRERTWTAYDTRTGEKSWTIDVPESATDQAADVADGPGYLTSTIENDTIQTHFVLLDPATGRQMADRVVFERPSDEGRVYSVISAGRNAIAFAEDPRGQRWQYFNVGADVSVPLDGTVAAADPNADVFIEETGTTGSSELRIRSGTMAAVGCTVKNTYSNRIGWLDGQVVLGSDETPIDPSSGDVTGDITLTAYRLADCRPSATERASTLPQAFVTAPGVLLMLAWPRDAASGELAITGYAPA